MKLERGCFGLGLLLVVNYMAHRQFLPAIYFGIVFCGLLVVYRKIKIDQMMEQALLRFALLLGFALACSIKLDAWEALGWFVLSILSSCFSQRLQKAAAAFLDAISCINIIVCTAVFCTAALSSWMNWDLSFGILLVCAVFQPSHLALDNPFESVNSSKSLSK